MTLDVVGAGFGGAGTLSLKLALEQLGFAPCHHMVEANKTPASLACWDAADGNPDWDKIYAGPRTTVDLLGTTFYAELAAYYPEAKVILTERDPQVWYESTQATIFKHLRALKARDPDHPFARMTDKVIGRLFGFGPGSPPVLISVFKAHNAKVREVIPAERLLIYEVAHGWSPLCTFLRVDIPKGPMPKVNSR